MTSADAAFSGSIPALYQSCLVPLLFTPYAEDMARRVAALRPRDILETAAGTGIVTAAMARAVPEARIVATDLNQAMLDVAAAEVGSAAVTYRQADAQSLPFDDAAFDVVVAQFGVMFFPDRVGAYREALRVLRPGGTFLFNVWDSLEENPVSKAIHEAVAGAFPDSPPGFLARVPFGYHDTDRVAGDLHAAGFRDISVETVRLASPVDARAAATGLCRGSPLSTEIGERGPGALDRASEAATAALDGLGLSGGAEAPMSAHVFAARA